jgi:hypothetical protein
MPEKVAEKLAFGRGAPFVRMSAPDAVSRTARVTGSHELMSTVGREPVAALHVYTPVVELTLTSPATWLPCTIAPAEDQLMLRVAPVLRPVTT